MSYFENIAKFLNDKMSSVLLFLSFITQFLTNRILPYA